MAKVFQEAEDSLSEGRPLNIQEISKVLDKSVLNVYLNIKDLNKLLEDDQVLEYLYNDKLIQFILQKTEQLRSLIKSITIVKTQTSFHTNIMIGNV